jgi:hypothetical protein
MLYNPLTAETTEMFRFLPASVASFTVPAFAYGVATYFLRHRRKPSGPAQPTDSTAQHQALTRRRSVAAPNI